MGIKKHLYWPCTHTGIFLVSIPFISKQTWGYWRGMSSWCQTASLTPAGTDCVNERMRVFKKEKVANLGLMWYSMPWEENSTSLILQKLSKTCCVQCFVFEHRTNEKWSLPSGNQVNKRTSRKIYTEYKEEVAIATPWRVGGRNEKKEEFV